MKHVLRALGFLACIAIAVFFVYRSVPHWQAAESQAAVTNEPATVLVVLHGPGTQQHRYTVEIAQDDAERQKGLMGRTQLAKGKGMLFVFPSEQQLSFWMKNTLIPLDILYFTRTGEFVSGVTMTPCTADPCATYPSSGPAMFALEIPAGDMRAFGVADGWRIDGVDRAPW